MEYIKKLSLELTPESVLTYNYKLKEGAILPTTALVESIINARSLSSLLLIALAIRNGAEVNTYVGTPLKTDEKSVNLHLLAFVYYYLSNKISEEIYNSIIVMLVYAGSNYKLPAVYIEGMEPCVEFSGLKITEFLDMNKYSHIIYKLDAKEEINSSLQMKIAEYLDRPDLLPKERDIELIIEAFSDKVLEVYHPLRDNIFDLCLKYYNSRAFKYYLIMGMEPSYTFINDMLLKLKDVKYYEVAYMEISKMLLFAIEIGITLDLEQFKLIQVTDELLYMRAKREYEKPYWKKVCSAEDSDGTPSERLKRLAFGITGNLSDSKKNICSDLQKISDQDPSLLIASFKKKQEQRYKNTVLGVKPFWDLSKEEQHGTCYICDNANINPTDYNDIDITYFTQNDKVWCFTSDTYAALLQSKINPYTSTELPSEVLHEMEVKLMDIRKLGFMYNRPSTFEKKLEELSDADTIENNEIMIEGFMTAAKLNGVTPERMSEMTSEQLQNVLLLGIGLEVNLSRLSSRHALITFIHIIYPYISDNPSLVKTLFEMIKKI